MKLTNRRICFSFLLLGLALLGTGPSALAQSMKPGGVKISSASGTVVAINGKTKESKPLKTGDSVAQGWTVVTGEKSKAVLLFSNGSSFTVEPKSSLSIDAYQQVPLPEGTAIADLKAEPTQSKTKLRLNFGKGVGNVKKLKGGSSYDVVSPIGTAGIRGTIFTFDTPLPDDATAQRMLRGTIPAWVFENSQKAETHALFPTRDMLLASAVMGQVEDVAFTPPVVPGLPADASLTAPGGGVIRGIILGRIGVPEGNVDFTPTGSTAPVNVAQGQSVQQSFPAAAIQAFSAAGGFGSAAAEATTGQPAESAPAEGGGEAGGETPTEEAGGEAPAEGGEAAGTEATGEAAGGEAATGDAAAADGAAPAGSDAAAADAGATGGDAAIDPLAAFATAFNDAVAADPTMADSVGPPPTISADGVVTTAPPPQVDVMPPEAVQAAFQTVDVADAGFQDFSADAFVEAGNLALETPEAPLEAEPLLEGPEAGPEEGPDDIEGPEEVEPGPEEVELGPEGEPLLLELEGPVDQNPQLLADLIACLKADASIEVCKARFGDIPPSVLAAALESASLTGDDVVTIVALSDGVFGAEYFENVTLEDGSSLTTEFVEFLTPDSGDGFSAEELRSLEAISDRPELAATLNENRELVELFEQSPEFGLAIAEDEGLTETFIGGDIDLGAISPDFLDDPGRIDPAFESDRLGPLDGEVIDDPFRFQDELGLERLGLPRDTDLPPGVSLDPDGPAFILALDLVDAGFVTGPEAINLVGSIIEEGIDPASVELGQGFTIVAPDEALVFDIGPGGELFLQESGLDPDDIIDIGGGIGGIDGGDTGDTDGGGTGTGANIPQVAVDAFNRVDDIINVFAPDTDQLIQDRLIDLDDASVAFNNAVAADDSAGASQEANNILSLLADIEDNMGLTFPDQTPLGSGLDQLIAILESDRNLLLNIRDNQTTPGSDGFNAISDKIGQITNVIGSIDQAIQLAEQELQRIESDENNVFNHAVGILNGTLFVSGGTLQSVSPN